MPLSYMHAIMYKIHKACLGIPSTTSTTFCFFDSLQTLFINSSNAFFLPVCVPEWQLHNTVSAEAE